MAASLKTEATGRSGEPSMEDILASIRKIISDEDAKPAKSAPAPQPVAKASPPPEPVKEASQDDIDALMAGFEAEATEPDGQTEATDVLELTEEMAEVEDEPPPRPAPLLRAVPDPEPEPQWEQPLRRTAPPSPRIEPQRLEDRLISAATDNAITSAFSTLTHTILAQNARTLDDLVQDMLRPMLKSWLDDNLPTLVERLVRAEIERVSRGGR